MTVTRNNAKRTPKQAQADLEALLDKLAAEGFTVNGWDDGSIYLFSHRPEDQDSMPRSASGSGWEIKPRRVDSGL